MGLFEKLIIKSNIEEKQEQTVDNISQNTTLR